MQNLSLYSQHIVKISGPNRSAKVTDHFTCISVNVIYTITYTLCKKIYIGDTGRRLTDRFGKHLGDVEKNYTDASKPVACYFNLPNHLTATWIFASYPCTTETQKITKISNKNIKLPIGLTLSRWDQRTPLISLIYSQIHVTKFPPCNGKVPPHSHVPVNTALFLHSL